jgi:uncharacterized membrane protein
MWITSPCAESCSIANMIRRIKLIRPTFPMLLFIGILTLVAALFLYIALTNHSLYRTYALDLGYFNHALYQLCQFEWPIASLGLEGRVIPYFGDHFSLIIILFAPLYALIGDSTLLWIQVFSVIVCAIYLRKLALHYQLSPLLSSLVPLLSLSCWAVFSSIGFDFHANVIGAMLVPGVIYYILKEKLIPAGLFILLILICKENMPLWVFFILTGLLIFHRKNLSKNTRIFLLISSVFSILYFLAVTLWWIPALHPSGTNVQLDKYIGSGGGLRGVVEYCLINPLSALKLLVFDPNGNLAPDKLKFALMFLASGGMLWFVHPVLLWMSIPIAAQKFLSLNGGPWGIESHYSIEIVPLIGYGSVLFLRTYSKELGYIFIGVSTAVSLYFNYQIYITTQPRVNILEPSFTQTRLKIDELNVLMKQIPEGASVSCVSIFAPRLANRKFLYHFPNINDAEYIALLKGNLSTYPLNKEIYQKELSRLKQDSTWYAWQYTADAVVFKRR